MSNLKNDFDAIKETSKKYFTDNYNENTPSSDQQENETKKNDNAVIKAFKWSKERQKTDIERINQDYNPNNDENLRQPITRAIEYLYLQGLSDSNVLKSNKDNKDKINELMSIRRDNNSRILKGLQSIIKSVENLSKAQHNLYKFVADQKDPILDWNKEQLKELNARLEQLKKEEAQQQETRSEDEVRHEELYIKYHKSTKLWGRITIAASIAALCLTIASFIFLPVSPIISLMIFIPVLIPASIFTWKGLALIAFDDAPASEDEFAQSMHQDEIERTERLIEKHKNVIANNENKSAELADENQTPPADGLKEELETLRAKQEILKEIDECVYKTQPESSLSKSSFFSTESPEESSVEEPLDSQLEHSPG